MKKVINRFSLITFALLISFSTVAAQHMQHSQQDTTKQKIQHHMMTDSTQTHHQVINDSTKMKHKNMMHHKMKVEQAKDASNMHADIWNAYCPVKGGEVDPEAPTVQYKGKTIGFCCPGCDSKFMAEPGKYMKNLSEDGQKFIGKK